MRLLFLFLFFTAGAFAQPPAVPANLKLMGTRSWIRLQWLDQASNEQGFKIYWSTVNKKPDSPLATASVDAKHYYIQGIQEETKYYVWIESYNESGSSQTLNGIVTTVKKWSLDPEEVSTLTIKSSKAVPDGMELFWNDEFNDALLNRNKWSTNYYSNIDYLKKDNLSLMLNDSLPQPGMIFNGSTINLITNDSIPLKSFYPESGRKISSIQTYDWRTNVNYLDNSRGGYFEVRVKRNSSGNPKGLNTAFWFDSPGPDLKNYLQEGTKFEGVTGVRPKGQVFEIDVFELLNAQFVLHGHVDKRGRFVHNLATHIAEGYTHVDNWVTHGILWTPNSIKHYINGELVKAYNDNKNVYSPNHFMNVFLGSYGAGGSVNMEVDYIRGYQWPLRDGNELPNANFEANTSLLPWEGTGTLSAAAKRTGNYGLTLEPGQRMEQVVYLNNSALYELEYWMMGEGKMELIISNLKQVTSKKENSVKQFAKGQLAFNQHKVEFKTGKEYGDYIKTVKIEFRNVGKSTIVVDDVKAIKKVTKNK